MRSQTPFPLFYSAAMSSVGAIIPAVNSTTGSGSEQGSPDSEQSKGAPDLAAAKPAPFSVYTIREKWGIIALASFAALFRSVLPAFDKLGVELTSIYMRTVH